MNQQFLEALKTIMGEEHLLMEEPLKKHTTFRIGGPAEVFVSPDLVQLPMIVKSCKQYGISYTVIGNGSNLLVGDKGIRGLVIELAKPAEEIEFIGSRMIVGAGTLLSKAANEAAERELAGMEFAAGIPGSIGGAVVMNAGAYGGEMKDIIESVTVLDEDGEEQELSVEELELSYRHSCILEKKYLVLEVTLKLERSEKTKIKERMAELREQRIAKQPLEYPSAGSTFKRPEGYFAGKLIMDAGLKGYRVGGAQVSEKHAGFVINTGDATAADVKQLIADVSKKVKEQFGVTLEPEVKMIGEF
ncbi:MAG: UDP-N-acetylmuramate dehydrogenase [Roseburia sp.]